MEINLKVLGVILARGGSKGIPKKNIKEINGKELLFYASPFLGKPYSEQTSNMLLRGIIWAYPKVEPKIHTSNVHPKRTFSYFVSNYFDIEMKFYLSSHFQRKEYERSYES